MERLNNKTVQFFTLSCVSFTFGYVMGYKNFPFNYLNSDNSEEKNNSKSASNISKQDDSNIDTQ